MLIRICDNCGNIYYRKAGMTLISNCPVCKKSNYQEVETEG